MGIRTKSINKSTKPRAKQILKAAPYRCRSNNSNFEKKQMLLSHYLILLL